MCGAGSALVFLALHVLQMSRDHPDQVWQSCVPRWMSAREEDFLPNKLLLPKPSLAVSMFARAAQGLVTRTPGVIDRLRCVFSADKIAGGSLVGGQAFSCHMT